MHQLVHMAQISEIRNTELQSDKDWLDFLIDLLLTSCLDIGKSYVIGVMQNG